MFYIQEYDAELGWGWTDGGAFGEKTTCQTISLRQDETCLFFNHQIIG